MPYARNKDGHPIAARGKLFSAHQYIRKQLKNSGLIPTKSQRNNIVTSQDLPAKDFTQDIEDEILWLKNNVSPFPLVLEKWKFTREFRLHTIKKTSIEEYLQSFPALRESMGYKLFTQDFSLMFPDKECLFFIKWPFIFRKLLNIATARKDPFLQKQLQDNRQTDTINDISGRYIHFDYVLKLI